MNSFHNYVFLHYTILHINLQSKYNIFEDYNHTPLVLHLKFQTPPAYLFLTMNHGGSVDSTTAVLPHLALRDE